MHPSAVLLIWLLATLLIQFMSPMAMAALAGVVMCITPWRHGWQLVWRARWLLISMYLILAYAVPGTAFLDLDFLPTWEGMASATLQVFRLILMLGVLAGLTSVLSRDALVVGLYGLLMPLASLGVRVDRLVVRLALVLMYLERPASRDPWRNLVTFTEPPDDQTESIRLSQVRWTMPDTGKLFALSCLLMCGLLI